MVRRIHEPRNLSRFLSYSILKSEFNNLGDVMLLEKRVDLWKEALDIFGGSALTYIEFGVYRGEAISYFCSKNQNQESKFLGLDSFEGLPESWAGNPVGYFTTNGVIPDLDDSHVSFLKGYLQQTWDKFLPEISDRNNLLVHFDTDLYSSTLFALTKIDMIKK